VAYIPSMGGTYRQSWRGFARVRVNGVEGERTAKAGKLSKLVMEISSSQFELGMLPI
jgi:hypothetical protein